MQIVCLYNQSKISIMVKVSNRIIGYFVIEFSKADDTGRPIPLVM